MFTWEVKSHTLQYAAAYLSPHYITSSSVLQSANQFTITSWHVRILSSIMTELINN